MTRSRLTSSSSTDSPAPDEVAGKAPSATIREDSGGLSRRAGDLTRLIVRAAARRSRSSARGANRALASDQRYMIELSLSPGRQASSARALGSPGRRRALRRLQPRRGVPVSKRRSPAARPRSRLVADRRVPTPIRYERVQLPRQAG